MAPGTRRILSILIVGFSGVLIVGPAAAAPSTVGLWHMDETSGTSMTDASGHGNTGSLEHVTFASPGFGGSSGAYSFNGTDSRVVVPDDASLNPGAQNVSVTAHVRFTVAPPPSVGDYDVVRKKGQGQIYKMEILGTGQAYCQFKGSSANKALKGGPNLADGSWHTIVCQKATSQITLTVDGSQVASQNITIGSISSTTALVLGGKIDRSGDWYKGLLDEVSITVG